MSTEELEMLLGFMATIVGVLAAARVIMAWINRPRPTGSLPRELAERLERIERAVDATALEVERIGEGQRFLTHALGERSVVDLRRADSPGRVITPH
jgi:hypothetical protein